jgi:site-specific DNA-cytosine methylase
LTTKKRRYNVDNPFKSPAVLSVCTGMRGLETGIEAVLGNTRPVAYVEIEAFIIQNLIALMEQGVLDPVPVWADLTTFDAAPFYGKIHGLAGGYPCQGESIAGNTRGQEDPRFIWWHIERIITTAKPVWCFFENVQNHLNISYPIVQRSLREAGYWVEEGILSAEEVGAPHQRKRLFILALSMGHTKSDYQQWLRQLYSGEREPGRSGKAMDHSCFNGFKQEHKISTGRNCIINAGETVAYTEFRDKGKLFTGILEQSKKTKASERCSKTVADTGDPGLQRGKQPATFNKGFREQEPFGSIAECRFPMPPGPGQYPWEESRTIEPGMGCTAHGYNFREDLLRMYGNCVVWPTAAKAFFTLLKKHGITI